MSSRDTPSPSNQTFGGGVEVSPGSEVRFLLVGMARSGTTVLQRLAMELEDVWIPRETHFWRHAAAIADRFPPPLSRETTQAAFQWFLDLESSSELVIQRGGLVDGLPDDSYLWDLFIALIRSLSPSEAIHLGEKTPDHARWCPQLLQAVPHLAVVGLIRDPREVYRSHLAVPWGIKDPWSFAEKWVEHARILADLDRLFPDRTLISRYEDMTVNPSEVRGRLADLLDVGQTVGAGKAVDDIAEGLMAPGEWWKRGAVEPISVREDKWRSDVDPDAIAVIEYRTITGMEHWGYEIEIWDGNELSPPLEGDWSRLRTDGAIASSLALPVTANQMDAWQHSDRQRASAWKRRAEELNKEVAEISSLKDRAEKLQAEAKKWRIRYREEQIKRIETDSRRKVLVAKLMRLRARRWWRLGGVLARWRRQPLRLDMLIREMWAVATTQVTLPPLPDLTGDEERIARLEELRQAEAGMGSHGLVAAERAYDAGDYEACLELIDAGPPELGLSKAAHLLRRKCFIKLGELTAALTSVRLALTDRDDAQLRHQARVLEGRLRETEPRWLPHISGTAAEVSPIENAVLHILKESLPFFERGYTMRSRMTLAAQKLAGYDPTVVTSLGFPRNQGFEDFHSLDVVDGIAHHRLDLGSGYDTRSIPYDQILNDQATLTAGIAKKSRPALIQAGSGYRGYETALVGLAVARHLSVPLIYEMRSFLEHTWTNEFERSEQGEYYQRRHDQETRCLLESDFVITIAEAMRHEIMSRGVSGDKVAVVPNVVDVERFQPRPKSQSLLRRYGLDRRPILGYISNLGAREGIESLIIAVARLRESGTDVAGLVVGDGPERERLSALVSELGLTEHFVLTGHVANREIEDHYALIDLFVVPRVDDRAARLVTPLKPLEAMAMEIPVIASDLPALRELVAPGRRGEVFVPDDPDSLAHTAGELLGSPDRCRDLAEEAKEWILEERTVESNAKRYGEILSRVLEAG